MVKSTKIEIDNMRDKLTYKIFDVIKIEDNNYFLDKESKIIWDSDVNIIGLIKNTNSLIFFSEIDKIINSLNDDTIEINNYMKLVKNVKLNV